MKKNKPYYLKYYKECMRSGRMPAEGLCSFFEYTPLFHCVSPSYGGYWGFNGDCIYSDDIYAWADVLNVTPLKIRTQFTPLRQTIVLFLAAMNNEL